MKEKFEREDKAKERDDKKQIQQAEMELKENEIRLEIIDKDALAKQHVLEKEVEFVEI